MDAELATIVKVVTPAQIPYDEWDERSSRWNLFSETETNVRIIAVPSSQVDVVGIVRWAAKHQQTDIGVRAGGHGFFSSAAVVVDMRQGFDYATVNQDTGVATIGMGQTLAALDERTHPWHMPVGVVSHTGCGLLLTGGVGYLCKSHGTSADNIIEVTIVTSDGRVHVCSKDKEPDLFFAVRGAAPNLGIVTEVKAQCYKVPDAMCTLRAWPSSLENVQRLIDWADQEAVLNDPNMTAYVALMASPDKQALCSIHVVCVGVESNENDQKYKDLIGQLDNTGDIVLLPTSRVPFSTPQTMFDAGMSKQFWYVSQAYFPGNKTLTPASLKDCVDAYSKVPLADTNAMVIWEQRGSDTTSAYHQFPSDSCAQPRHGQRWECYVFYGTADKDNAETCRTQGRAMKETILKHAQPGGRSHLTKDEPSRIEFYYGDNSERLREVVAKYDPLRIFATCNGMKF
uniref:FAD-binding PCMH-type domain-containing protein n=1 Tax=Attheya septentrionalis TaxID=420275 RepID=A0A6T7KID5_9STRA|mmetsp:Transcript_7894/g.14218  ORF Transcript_7894/g.14218 Transcript_7894/m.14218 type:complete len:456 (+) Transcript_7894:101-1468(+)